MFKKLHFLMDQAGDGAAGSGAAGAGTAAAAGAGATLPAGNGSAATAAAAASDGKGAAGAGDGKGAAGDGKGAAGDGKGAATPDWPEDWQQRIAGDDKDELKQLSRYVSPKAVWEKARSLERRLSSGELKAALPKNAKPEEVAAWRKDNGIPEKADAYDIKLASGEKVPAEQKATVERILARAHATNMTNEQASAAVESYLAAENQRVSDRQALDEEQRLSTLDALAKEYGGNMRRNVNLVDGLLSKLPASVRDQVKSARLPDGTAIFNNIDVIRGLLAISLENNPAAIIAPAGGGDVGKTALDEYQNLQKFMRDSRAAYNKDAAKQGRMTELIEFLSAQGLIDNNGNVLQKKAA